MMNTGSRLTSKLRVEPTATAESHIDLEESSAASQTGTRMVLRMKRVDLETIYPQEEKDREAEKLKRLCDMQANRKSMHADGNKLISTFVKPHSVANENDRRGLDLKLTMSYKKSPEQMRFLRRLDRQAIKFNQTQYQHKLARNENDLRNTMAIATKDSRFLFGSKGEILFSDDDSRLSRDEQSDAFSNSQLRF